MIHRVMLDVCAANNFIELISLIRNSRRKGTMQYSYRQLADRLGYRSPRSLAMVHKGQRLPSPNLVRKLICQMQVTTLEAQLISLLAEKSIAEKKQIASVETEEKIKRLKTFIRHFNMFQICDESQFHESSLYLSPEEMDGVNQLINKFYRELVEKYSQPIDRKNKFRIKIHFYFDSL
jgi:hypothetical protein